MSSFDAHPTGMSAIAAIVNDLEWTTIGAVLGVVVAKGWDATARPARDWGVWLRDNDTYHHLMDIEDMGYRLEFEDIQTLEDISESQRGRRPPWVVRKVHRRWTRKRHARALQGYVEVNGLSPTSV
ncbi:MAG: hypothetical protein JRM86_02985 [Nitrososphaerota archaeon]|nr:hypothetical protein [Nitrososphaerota archaeon]